MIPLTLLQKTVNLPQVFYDADCSEFKTVDSLEIKSDTVVILDKTDIMDARKIEDIFTEDTAEKDINSRIPMQPCKI